MKADRGKLEGLPDGISRPVLDLILRMGGEIQELRKALDQANRNASLWAGRYSRLHRKARQSKPAPRKRKVR